MLPWPQTVDAGQNWMQILSTGDLPRAGILHVARHVTARPRHGMGEWRSRRLVWRSTDGGAELAAAAHIRRPTWAGSRPRMHPARGSASATSALAHDGRRREVAAPHRARAPTSVISGPTSRGGARDGSSISKTTDGGPTWQSVFTLPAGPPSPWFWDALTGWRATGAAMRTDDRRRRHLAGRGHRPAGHRCVQVCGRPQRLGLAQRVAGAGPHNRWRRHVAGPEHRQRRTDRSPVRGCPATVGLDERIDAVTQSCRRHDPTAARAGTHPRRRRCRPPACGSEFSELQLRRRHARLGDSMAVSSMSTTRAGLRVTWRRHR